MILREKSPNSQSNATLCNFDHDLKDRLESENHQW